MKDRLLDDHLALARFWSEQALDFARMARSYSDPRDRSRCEQSARAAIADARRALLG